MTPQATLTACGSRRFRVKRLAAEALSVTVAGGLFALLANRLSPAGLKLTRDYFPKTPPAMNQPVAPRPPSGASLEAQLQAKGLQTIPRESVFHIFTSPEYASEGIVFVDARNDDHYKAGHIPGAFAFDHYRPETAIAVVLPACLSATRVVVYCDGGDCEDSGFAALMLADSGVPRDRVFIYAGGFADWQAAKQPVEIGPRRSGQYRPVHP